MRAVLKTILDIPKNIAMWIIGAYQRILSPDHSHIRRFFPHGVCRFRPTCSEYTREAIYRYGFFRGLAMGISRILKCNPWNNGGNDPVK